MGYIMWVFFALLPVSGGDSYAVMIAVQDKPVCEAIREEMAKEYVIQQGQCMPVRVSN